MRVLGSHLCTKEDVKQIIQRANNLWVKLKQQLRKTKMTKRFHAKIIQAVVESTLLFDCQVRTWQKSDIKKLQSTVDQMYCFVWSKKIKPLLMEMQEKKNMQDTRN